MNCSLENKKLIGEEIAQNPDFIAFVKKIMKQVSGDEYLNCSGVIEGNVYSLKKKILSIMSRDSCNMETAMDILWQDFQD
jgi:hypothetical protein